ncbi:MAG: metallophosphoesterase [Acidobacteriota bacterium]|nr:metallophosphoesterase [Acidobacteriota bacterium]
MRIRFVHAADLHLDSPFTGLKAAAPENVANKLYSATFDAYDNIINFCISEEVDALLVAGDVYDGVDRSLRAQLKFVEGLKKLDAKGIRSFVCHGNHDPLDGWEARLDYPPGCFRFGTEWKAVPVFDDPNRAVIHSISYPKRDVTENLARRLGKTEPSPFSIGLLHANVSNDPNHAAYAPCSLDDLAASGFDYWALGHVHTRSVLSEHKPVVVYPGNPQGRHPNEAGPRGVYLVEVDDGGNVGLDFRPMDTVRWARLDLDIGAFETEQELLDALHERMQGVQDGTDGRSVVVRITLTGRGELRQTLRRPNTIGDLAEAINREGTERSPFVWCERIEDASASPFNREVRLKGSDFLAEVLRAADRSKIDAELLARLGTGLSDLYRHHRFRRYLSESTPNDEELAALVDEAEAIAVDLLAENDDR